MSALPLREHAAAIFQAALTAADPGTAVEQHLALERGVLLAGEARYPLESFRSLLLIGIGKASVPLAAPVLELLGERITDGLVVTKYGHGRLLPGLTLLEAGHPVPDEAGLQAAASIQRLLRDTDARTLVIVLLSGGASALAPAPPPGITLRDKQEMSELLLRSGAAIGEINAVRKHLSRLKGGLLARQASPSPLLSLILSDVVGDDPSTIASGPTAPDPTTYAQAVDVLRRYRVLDRVPSSIRERLEAGVRGVIPETPKAGDPVFESVRNLIVGSNALALEAARTEAAQLGYQTLSLGSFMEGEAREVARVHAAIAREIRTRGRPIPPPACILSGGETTVTVRGSGKGGRNQEFALAAALALHGLEDVLVLSAGTDGTDGPTDAAGAFADGSTVERGRAAGLEAREFLARNDSYPFFQALGDHFITGPTLTNVLDLHLILVG